MNYPLISEYVEAIKMAEDNFEELSYLRPVLDDTGQPVMSSGNFAVVFKMRDERDGKLYAVRCFHRDQEGRAESYRLIEEELKDVESPYLVSFRYMDKELFVDSSQTDETEFPILLMDWVEGITLDKYLRENLDDQYALEMLAYRFSQLAQWLIPQPFAHGDLKPDNILVREDGTLVLVDYDGMYVPAMKGQKARELGSPDFRHPLRTEDDFDEHIDDFPLVSILLSLKAISLNPRLLEEYGAADRLLFSNSDYRNIGNSNCLKALLFIVSGELKKLISLMILTCCDCIIMPNYNRLLSINIPTLFIPVIRGACNDEPCRFSLYNRHSPMGGSEMLFDYASFIDPSLTYSNSCIISKDLAPVEYPYSYRPDWPWTGSSIENAAIIACREDVDNPVWYKSIKRLKTNNQQFIANNYQEKYGVVDHQNHIVIDFLYNELEAIESERGYFLATNSNGLAGIIDIQNNIIIDFKYKICEGIKGGYFLCKKNGTNMLLSLDGEEIIIEFNGTIIHFGDIAVGITSPNKVIRDYDKMTMNKFDLQVFRKGKLSSTFSVSFKESWINIFKMTDENHIVIQHYPKNVKDCVYWPEDSYIDLEGVFHIKPTPVNWKKKSDGDLKNNERQQNVWLSNFVKEKYLIGVQLPYNDPNMPTRYEIKTIGNLALVSYSWDSLMYPDSGGGFLGYADEHKCYW